jgi:hypothetical protein
VNPATYRSLACFRFTIPELSTFIKLEECDVVTFKAQKLRELMHLEDDFLRVAYLVNKQDFHYYYFPNLAFETTLLAKPWDLHDLVFDPQLSGVKDQRPGTLITCIESNLS